jgi:small subunit ribosomal protein S24e
LELKILEERPNPLLKRVEYRFEVDHATAATPTRDAVRVELAKLVKTPKDRVIVERMNARFGTARSIGFAAAYQSTAAVNAVVREHVLIRNGLKEKAVKAAPGSAPVEALEPPKKEATEAPAKVETVEPHPKKDAAEPAGKKAAAESHPKKEAPEAHAKKDASAESAPKKEHSSEKPPKKESADSKKGA